MTPLRHALTPALALGLSSAAAAQVFTDRAAFENAVPGFTKETFEGAPLVGTSGAGAQASITFPDFKVDTVPNAAKVLDMPFFGADNTTPGGKNYLYLDTDIGGQGSVSTFTPNTPVFAVGFDYTSIGNAGLLLTVQGQTYSAPGTPSTMPSRFWGFVSTTPITTFVIDSGTDSGFGVDDATLGSPCTSPSFAYGQGCAGSGGFVPALSGDPCAEVGQPYTLTVDQGPGGATAVFFLGAAQGSFPLGGGCTYLLSPVFPPLFSVPLGGAGPGNGSVVLPQVVPAAAPVGAVVTLQVLIAESSQPAGLSASNGWQVTIN